MTENPAPQFLYLTTIGRKSGKPHLIEIWFVEHEGCVYMIHEGGIEGDWVRNIRHNPAVTYSIGSREAAPIEATGRLIDPASEPELDTAVKALMQAKYEWSEGLVVELKPNEERKYV